MLDQLKELLEMQRVLDESILKEHGNIYDYEIADKMKIALFVELGELMQELPTTFKHWKKTAKDNREKALEEYVDALHFQMSLMNYYGVGTSPLMAYDDLNDSRIETHYLLKGCINYCHRPDGIMSLFKLGNRFGFKWEEIYAAYKKKNTVNYERLRSGY